MSNLKMYLLGAPQIEVDGKIVPIRCSKALALLIYLAVNGRPHNRIPLQNNPAQSKHIDFSKIEEVANCLLLK